MNKRLLSVIFALCLISSSLIMNVGAVTGHQYYSQWGNDTGKDNKLCAITCLSMIISDLGNPATPTDVFNANKKSAVATWGTIGNKYGINIQEVSLVSSDPNGDKNRIISLLNSGKYPQGIMLTIKYGKNEWHYVVARKVVNGVIYCDDPGKSSGGCCIPLENCSHYASDGSYAGLHSYRLVTRSSSWSGSGTDFSGNNNTATTEQISTLNISLTSYPVGTLEQGNSYPLRGKITSNYSITSVTGSIVDSSGQTVMSYTQNPNTTSFNIRGSAIDMNLKFGSLSAGTYTLQFAAKNSAGTTENWSQSFTVAGETTAQTYEIIFDANGGRVSPSSVTLEVGESYKDFPTPTYTGYKFVGWTLYQVDPDFNGTTVNVIVSDTAVFDFADDVTLYALWTKIPDASSENNTSANEPIYRPWTDWSATKVAASSTRQVETREVKVSDAYTEYRYGRYEANGHDCWCSTYLEGLGYGRASLGYSSWTTTQYTTSGKGWSCGYCRGSHTGISHTGSDGRPWWGEYKSPDGKSYYWEESRTIDAVYETQYRYRDRVS